MGARHWLRLAAATSTIALAGGALAADAGTTTSQMQTSPSAAGSVQGYVPPGPASVGGSERMDNSNAVPVDEWAREYAATHGGRVTRDEYLGYVGRRWDAIDVGRRGYLTPEEARVIYVVPENAHVIYIVPHETPPSDVFVDGPGGMQATPGANGPASPKGE